MTWNISVCVLTIGRSILKVPIHGSPLYRLGVVNGPLKNEKSQQILPKSRSLAQPSNGSQSLRFCVCWSHICFSIKSLNFSVLVSDFKMPVLASRRVSDLPFASPQIGTSCHSWFCPVFSFWVSQEASLPMLLIQIFYCKCLKFAKIYPSGLKKVLVFVQVFFVSHGQGLRIVCMYKGFTFLVLCQNYCCMMEQELQVMWIACIVTFE